jgi:uncharacterized protein YrrD
MRKGKSLIGKPILSFDEGQRLGEVRDVILGADNAAVVGLVTDEGGLFESSKVVPSEEIASFGRDAVVVRSTASVMPAGQAPGIKPILDRKQSLIGTKVFTETGDDQGAVGDIYFDEATGRVEAMEVTGGRVSDLTTGTRHLPVDQIVRIGPDVLYVHPETADHLEAQRGGISGALGDAGDAAKDAAGKASAKASELGSQGADAAKGARGQAGQAVADARPEERLIGQRAGRDVEDDTGGVLVANGQRIRAEDVERARSAGKLPDLTASVGFAQVGTAGAATGDALGDAGDQAADLWDRFTAKLGEMKDATGQRVDEQQTKARLAAIEDAVGRPVTKVVLDLQDDVILDLGDLITHAAIQRAHDAGALDTLLGSVYRGEVSFDKDELRARRPGAASLDEGAAGGAPIVEELRSKVQIAQREHDAAETEERERAEADRKRRAQERDDRGRQRAASKAERGADAAEGRELAAVGAAKTGSAGSGGPASR